MSTTKEELYKINGSGLFFFKSDISDNKKLAIVDWYNSLAPREKDYVDLLRTESSTEEHFFNQGD